MHRLAVSRTGGDEGLDSRLTLYAVGMSDHAVFDPALADEAVVTGLDDDRWTTDILHAPDTLLASWEFECPGTFDPDVLNIVGPRLNALRVAYKGSGAWHENAGS